MTGAEGSTEATVGVAPNWEATAGSGVVSGFAGADAIGASELGSASSSVCEEGFALVGLRHMRLSLGWDVLDRAAGRVLKS
jgi:hypothetical protein